MADPHGSATSQVEYSLIAGGYTLCDQRIVIIGGLNHPMVTVVTDKPKGHFGGCQ